MSHQRKIHAGSYTVLKTTICYANFGIFLGMGIVNSENNLMNKAFFYKIYHSVIPCFLLTLSIGFCYAFSLFVPHLAETLNASRSYVQFSFCLNIFFLGMGAAFFGGLVERHIKIASFISTAFLFIGFVLAHLSVVFKSIWLLYVGIGVFCGLSEGCGYVVPVKNLLLWWNKTKKKGLISAISIISFGLGSTLCSYLFGILFPIYGIDNIFLAFAFIYAVPMLLAAFIINKPKYAIKKLSKFKSVDLKNLISNSFFRRSWLFMFLNIAMGLILIGSCASILKEVNLADSTIIVVMMLCGVFNGAGRLVFPLISDFLKKRTNIWLLTLVLECAIMLPPMFAYALIPISVIIINSTYGSGFATLPSVLSDYYGNSNLSQIHGYVLSAWGFASLFAYLCTIAITSFCSKYYFLVFVLFLVYVVNLVNVLTMKSVPRE